MDNERNFCHGDLSESRQQHLQGNREREENTPAPSPARKHASRQSICRRDTIGYIYRYLHYYTGESSQKILRQASAVKEIRIKMNRVFRFINRIDNAFCWRFLNYMDATIDRRICGQSLVKYVPSIYRDDKNGVGGTGTQSTHYWFLKRIFKNVELLPSDVFIDVGCGKGRVLAYLIKEKCPCKLLGIEHNAEVGAIASSWTEKYPQANVMIGDAFQYDYNTCTVLSLARSFLPKTFLRFVEYLERTQKHPIRLVYWYDQESGYLLRGRPGWEMVKREVVRRIYGIRISPYPQGYSIWKYTPPIESAL